MQTIEKMDIYTVNGDGNGGRYILADPVDGPALVPALQALPGRPDNQRSIM